MVLRSSLVPIAKVARAASIALTLALSSPALAQQAGGADAGVSENPAVAVLEAQIERDLQALSTEGCAVACRALASMQRSVERLCALESGPRCRAARAKMRDAENRVRTACPECGMAANAPAVKPAEPSPPPPAAPPSDKPMEKRGARGDKGWGSSPQADEEQPRTADSNAPRKGGCAGCTVDDGAGGALGAGALAAAIAIAALRRRRRTR